MRKIILTSLVAICSCFTINAQWNGTNPVWTASNVGIGTGSGGGIITPVEKLTIGEMGGNFAVQDRRTSTTEKYTSGYKFYDYYGESASILLEHNGYFGNSARALKFQINGEERIRINANGNVGIGITNPLNKLDVKGTIHSQEVKVDMLNWSDFVFKKNYNLPTLAEVEKYINANGHLENIPTEAEVLKNGINLGEMNTKLLQKIEELTLYTIEQEKKINAQSQEIEALKALSLRVAKIENELARK